MEGTGGVSSHSSGREKVKIDQDYIELSGKLHSSQEQCIFIRKYTSFNDDPEGLNEIIIKSHWI